ncbi:MAG: HTH-type transcriptional regulator BetI [Candidatus Izimaplasma bacterium HR2]|nr:MAG: HTH-type transcriptional regulator BetI [Candidatus Izimaplasma bacterium HR2]
MSEFLHKDDQRKDRILEAALIEFSDKGYKKASTNTIVREAGVSKGLLFHYYKSKKDLYILLFSYANKVIEDEIYAEVNFADRDVLNRLYQSTITNIEAYDRHPLFVKLFELNAKVEEPEIIEATLKIGKDTGLRIYEKAFNNIDYYLFSDTINIDRSLEVIKWTIDRISADWKLEHKFEMKSGALEQLSMDVSHYLDLFRSAFYR